MIELIIGLVIVAILATLAAPSFTGMMARQRVSSATNDLVAAINLARSEAATRGRFITLCIAGTSQGACDGSAGTMDWAGNKLIFLDNNGDGAMNSGETLIKVISGSSTNIKIKDVSTSGSANKITFRPYGLISGGNGRTFHVCGVGIKDGREVSMLAFGLPTTVAYTESSC